MHSNTAASQVALSSADTRRPYARYYRARYEALHALELEAAALVLEANADRLCPGAERETVRAPQLESLSAIAYSQGPHCGDCDSTGRSEHATVLCGGREVAAPCESCAVVDDYSDLGAHYRCDGARCPGVGREACAQPGTRLSDGAWLLSSGRPVCDLCCVLAVCGTTEGDEAERVHSVIVEMAG